jgi:hypothetical protein
LAKKGQWNYRLVLKQAYIEAELPGWYYVI